MRKNSVPNTNEGSQGSMTKDEHDRIVHEFVGYLNKSGITDYATEHPVRLDGRNLGFVDVIVWAWDHVFLFDIKSDSNDLSNDIQRVKKYAYSLRRTQPYMGRTIHPALVYDAKLRDRISDVRNLFKGVRALFIDERNVPLDLDGQVLNLKEIIERSRGRFPRLRTILRIIASNR